MSEAELYLSDLNKKIQKLARSADSVFIDAGCTSYVKTIYIGYDIDGEMVAALYAHTDHVEVALALDEHHNDSGLVDATHLTWRTLPVAFVLTSDGELPQFRQLVEEACARVRAGSHKVNRDNEFFIKSRRERRGR